MISVPSFLLKRLYVKGSLCNTDNGVQFEIENKLGSGYGKELKPLTIDDQTMPLENTYFVLNDSETSFSSVDDDHPFTLPMNQRMTIKANGITLDPGIHKIGMQFVAEGIGMLSFEVKDAI